MKSNLGEPVQLTRPAHLDMNNPLTEYNTRNIFPEKSYIKFGGETIPRPFSLKSKIEHISGSIALIFIQFAFIVCQVEGYRNILKVSCRPLAFTSV